MIPRFPGAWVSPSSSIPPAVGPAPAEMVVGEISWSHNLVILDRCKDDLELEFYLRIARRMGWTRRVLVQQIENQTYEKTLLSQTNFAETVPEPIRDQARPGYLQPDRRFGSTYS